MFGLWSRVVTGVPRRVAGSGFFCAKQGCFRESHASGEHVISGQLQTMVGTTVDLIQSDDKFLPIFTDPCASRDIRVAGFLLRDLAFLQATLPVRMAFKQRLLAAGCPEVARMGESHSLERLFEDNFQLDVSPLLSKVVLSPLMDQYIAFLQQFDDDEHTALLLAAFYPCYGIWRGLAGLMPQDGSLLAQQWSAIYSSEQFFQHRHVLLHAADDYGASCSDVSNKMLAVAQKSCCFERRIVGESFELELPGVIVRKLAQAQSESSVNPTIC